MCVMDLASDVNNGETRNGLTCPVCHGGQKRDKSLSITREDGFIKWICFRASCGYRGVSGDNPNNDKFLENIAVNKPKPLDETPPIRTEEITQEQSRGLREKYGLRLDEVALVKQSANYWVFPVHDMYGNRTGIVQKKHRFFGPKNLVHGQRGQMHFTIPPHSNNGTVIIVEDWLSGTKVGRYCPTVALLGTNLSQKQAVLLSDHYERAIFMLDKDAWGKSVDYCKKFNCLFASGCDYATWESGLDPKDMSIAELETILRNKKILNGEQSTIITT